MSRLRAAAVRLLEAREDVLEIRLFGSLARGDAVPGSDADLLIVVRDGPGRFLDRSATLAPYFVGVGLGCDLLVYTESEVERLCEGPSIAKTALEYGVLLGDARSGLR